MNHRLALASPPPLPQLQAPFAVPHPLLFLGLLASVLLLLPSCVSSYALAPVPAPAPAPAPAAAAAPAAAPQARARARAWARAPAPAPAPAISLQLQPPFAVPQPLSFLRLLASVPRLWPS